MDEKRRGDIWVNIVVEKEKNNNNEVKQRKKNENEIISVLSIFRTGREMRARSRHRTRIQRTGETHIAAYYRI